MTDGGDWGPNFGGSGMRVYEEVLVGRMFEPWGRRLLDTLAVEPGDRVLDVACGPGSVTRLASARVGRSGSVAGCDLNGAMLEIARAKPPVDDGAPITYAECPADALDADDSDFDVVVCQQGLQFFADRVASLREMRRAARPGGRLGVAVWAEIENCPPMAAVEAALGEVFGSEASSAYRAGPWGFPDPDALRLDVEAAGFREVRVEREILPIIFEGGVEQLQRTLGAAPIAPTISALDAEGRARLLDALRRAAAPITDGAEVRSEMTSNIAIAVA